jgi:predicted RNA-binding Zn ribbon-like protein
MVETNKFPVLSGHLSLDLVNTELIRRGQRHDLMESEGDLIEWLRVMNEKHSVLNESYLLKVKESSGKVLPNLLKMRSLLREQFEFIAAGQKMTDEFIVVLEQLIDKSPFTFKLINQTLIPVPIGEVEDSLLSILAYDALSLIAENKLPSIKRCSNEECILLFIDESGRRKWCSMKICGNRKKVARHQQKKNE